MTTQNSVRFDPRYVVVLAACVTQFTIIGGVFAYGVFLPVLEAEFGWSRLLLSSCTSIAFIVSGVLAILSGRLSDRFGPRPVLLVTGLITAIGYWLLGGISQSWQLLFIYGLFVGIGIASHDVVTLSTIAGWFEKRRGMMTGVVKVGTAVGQISVPPIVAALITSFGWRDSFQIMGIAAGILLIACALLFRRAPARQNAAANTASYDGLDYQQARRTRQFWTLCGIQFMFFPSVVTIPLHIAAHGTDIGMTIDQAAWLLSVLGACSIIGRLTIGTLVDRIGARMGYILCFSPLIVCLIALQFIHASTGLFLVIAFYGVAHGGFFTVVSPAVAEYFGMKAHGALFGIILFCGTIGGAFGPILAGWIFDVTGNYAIAFGGLAALGCLGLMLVVSLRPLSADQKQSF